ncbi:MAG: PDZ domain-containing protein, partial [Pyrinomonadaceae bacterium]
IYGVVETSPLYRAGARDGDTLLTADGVKLHDPQQLVNELSKPDKKVATVTVYRHEWVFTSKLPPGTLLPGNNALEQLGIGNWACLIKAVCHGVTCIRMSCRLHWNVEYQCYLFGLACCLFTRGRFGKR